MKGRPSLLLRFRRFVAHGMRLQGYLRHPGDGRVRPRIPAEALLWALLMGRVLREGSHRAIEALVGSRARAALGVSHAFSDDTLNYFTERLDPAALRAQMAGSLRQAKRNKAFDGTRWIGLALDGSGAGAAAASACRWCHPVRNAERQVVGQTHRLVAVSGVGTGLTLPCDAEPYPAGDSEYAAGQRALRRAVEALGPRFADYAVVDGEFATAPFLHTAGDLGLHVVARLKDNLPLLAHAARQRFEGSPPHLTFTCHGERIELWDADDFDPWDTLRWSTVRVLRYRQYHRDGTICEAYWLTDFAVRQVGPQALFRLAKSRWEIENQGFNDAKNRYGLEHICHHHPNSLLIEWLLVLWAMSLERLFRQRYLHRGSHPVRAPIALLRAWRLELTCAAPRCDSS